MMSKLLGCSLKLLSFLESPQLRQPPRPPLWFKHHAPESTVLLRFDSKKTSRRQQGKCLWKSCHNKRGAPQPHKGHPWGKAHDIRRPGPWPWEKTTLTRAERARRQASQQTSRALCVWHTQTHTPPYTYPWTYDHHADSSSIFNTETS